MRFYDFYSNMAEPVHEENEGCNCPTHMTGCDVAKLKKRQRFYRDLYLEELEWATDRARKAHALADRVADQRDIYIDHIEGAHEAE